jgi:hypothetical protein
VLDVFELGGLRDGLVALVSMFKYLIKIFHLPLNWHIPNTHINFFWNESYAPFHCHRSLPSGKGHLSLDVFDCL